VCKITKTEEKGTPGLGSPDVKRLDDRRKQKQREKSDAASTAVAKKAESGEKLVSENLPTWVEGRWPSE